MKSHRKGAVLAVALCAAVLAGLFVFPAAAVDPSRTTVTLRPNVTILVDGAERTFYDVNGQEVHPLYANGTHYLPVRAIGELMGKNVNWDAATRTIGLTSPRTAAPTSGTPDTSAKECQINVEVRSDITILVDGVRQNFTDAAGNPVYPLLTNGTNYLPVRAIGELMGKDVGWNAASRTITLGAASASGAPNVTDADTFQSGGTAVTPPAASNSGESSLIGEANAKTFALALVSGAGQQHITKCELDRDDGVWIYELEIVYNNTEYEIELDGTTGRVLKLEQEYKGGQATTQQTSTQQTSNQQTGSNYYYGYHHNQSHHGYRHNGGTYHHHNSNCPVNCPY